MSLDNKSKDDQRSSATKRSQAFSNNLALAMELPFTLVGAIGVGVVLGYFLDRWLHTRAVFMILLGALGFIAGVREVIRRLPGTGDGTKGS
jgi:ATP synthase protein I